MKKYIITIIIILLSACSKQEIIVDKNDLYFIEGINRVESSIKAPEFTLKNVSDDNISLSDYRGKVVFINFWANWCAPCKEEMPTIENLKQLTKDLDVVIITINVAESKEIVENYLNENKYTFISLLDTDKKVSTDYAVRSIPSTFILNKKGMVVGTKLGAHDWDGENVIKILKELL